MCGIYGLFGPRARVNLDLEAWGFALAHRGPDDAGTFLDERGETLCALGHRRLSIIDLSASGRQPMESADGRYVLVFNGEIYNFRSIRKELEACGSTFRSSSDSEVLLQAFARWHARALEKLRGMFAFAIWDRRERRLFIARDRLGVKPLYFARYAPGGIVFASEVRALLASGLVERRMSSRGLSSFLAFGSVYEPQTIVEGVEALAPGSWLEISEGGETRGRYYQLPISAPGARESGDELNARVRHTLEDAVRLRLEADVDVGVFLSSGIDSTVVAALARRAAEKRLHTVTVTFDEAAWDEGEPARELAQRLGTEHHEIRLVTAEMAQQIEVAVGALDQPSVDGINTYFVSKAARDAGLKVALSGIGGDELFAGYSAFRVFDRAHRLRHVRDAISRTGVLSHFQRIPRVPIAANKMLALLAAGKDVGGTYACMRRLFFAAHRSRLLVRDDAQLDLDPELVSRVSAALQAGHIDAVNAYGLLDLSHYIRNTLLRDTDAMSMAHGLEVREPLLDHELIAVAFSIPGSLKLGGPGNKRVLTSAVPEVPRSTTVAKKRGFTLPFERWMRTTLRPFVEERLLDRQSQFIEPREVRRLWGAFLSGRREVTWARMWALTALFDYARQHRLTS